MKYYETKVAVNRMQESGVEKRVTECYVVDAMSCTEAEGKTVDFVSELQAENDGTDAEVMSVRAIPISEVIGLDGEKWFLAKVAFITIDERTAKEKEATCIYLVAASDFGGAKKALEDVLKTGMSDYKIKEVKETAYIDVI